MTTRAPAREAQAHRPAQAPPTAADNRHWMIQIPPLFVSHNLVSFLPGPDPIHRRRYTSRTPSRLRPQVRAAVPPGSRSTAKVRMAVRNAFHGPIKADRNHPHVVKPQSSRSPQSTSCGKAFPLHFLAKDAAFSAILSIPGVSIPTSSRQTGAPTLRPHSSTAESSPWRHSCQTLVRLTG